MLSRQILTWFQKAKNIRVHLLMKAASVVAVVSGLMPRLIGELLTIWFVNVINHVVNSHLASHGSQVRLLWCCQMLSSEHSQEDAKILNS